MKLYPKRKLVNLSAMNNLTLLTQHIASMPPSGTPDWYHYIVELFEDMALVATRTIVFGVAGTLTAENNASFEIPIPENLTCLKVYINVKTAPTGCQLIVDVNLDGTTIFSTQANRPMITAGQKNAESGTPNVQSYNKNQILSIDIDQIGSTVAGADLIVEARCKVKGI